MQLNETREGRLSVFLVEEGVVLKELRALNDDWKNVKLIVILPSRIV